MRYKLVEFAMQVRTISTQSLADQDATPSTSASPGGIG
ncbi:hypothetical protein C7S14_2015 [Burkholderia cepacia]|nr:hypothetical protein C7S14_2015 [Burkholderia cepacia]